MDEFEQGLVDNIRDFVINVSFISGELYELDCTLNDETDPQSVAKLMKDIETEFKRWYTHSKVDLALNPLRYFIDQQRRVVAAKQMLLDMLYKTVYPVQTGDMEGTDEILADTTVVPYRREHTPNSMRSFKSAIAKSAGEFRKAVESNERMRVIGGFDWVGMHRIDARFFTSNGFMKEQDAVVETEGSNFVFLKTTWFDHDKIKDELVETNQITVAELADRIRTKIKLAEQTLAMDRVAGVHGDYLGQMFDNALTELTARTTVKSTDLIDVTFRDKNNITCELKGTFANTCVHFRNDVPNDTFTATDDISTTDPSCVTRRNLYETYTEPAEPSTVWHATKRRSVAPASESTMKIVAETEKNNRFMDGYNMYLAPKYMETVVMLRKNTGTFSKPVFVDTYHIVIVTRSTAWHGGRPMFIHDTLMLDTATKKYKRKNPDDAKGYTWDKFISVMKTKCPNVNPRSMIGIFSSGYLHKSCLTSRELWAITHQVSTANTIEGEIGPQSVKVDPPKKGKASRGSAVANPPKKVAVRVLDGMTTRGADNVWALAVVCDDTGNVVSTSDYDIVSNSMKSPTLGFALIYFHKKVGDAHVYAIACANGKVATSAPTLTPLNSTGGAYTLHTGWVPKDQMLNADYFTDAGKYLSGPTGGTDNFGKPMYHAFLSYENHKTIIDHA